MAVANQQNAVFNRTNRIEIPVSCVRRNVEPRIISFQGLHPGEWSLQIDSRALEESVLYIDIRSLLLLKRIEVAKPSEVFGRSWEGCVVSVPGELTNGDYRVRMQITIAFPPGHPEAGRIIARSCEIIVVDGPDQPSGSGSSLLRVSPAADDMPEISRLVITETGGPVLYVNTRIAGLSWRELAEDPKFKFSVFPYSVREILQYLVFNDSCRGTWGAPWLDLKGIKGRPIPDIDELSPQDAWREVDDYVRPACEGFMEQLHLATRLSKAIARKGGGS